MRRKLGPDNRRNSSSPPPARWSAVRATHLVEALEERRLFAVSLPGAGGVGAAPDTIAPTAMLTRAVPNAAGLGEDIDVTYTDDIAVDTTTLDNKDIRVTGAAGAFSQLATLISFTDISTTIKVGHYRVPSPTVFGTYTVSVVASEVADTSMNFVAAGAVGTFMAGLPQGGGNGPPPNFSARTWRSRSPTPRRRPPRSAAGRSPPG